MNEILLATANQHKIKEIKNILCRQIITLEDLKITPSFTEDGLTFEENALKKALLLSELTGKLCLADDSGLEIDYLGGKPGIFSARFGGDIPQSEKNRLVLELLKGVPQELRTARFVCVAALVFPDGQQKLFRGTLEGIIAEEEAGSLGFGYDPIFYLPLYEKTIAQLSSDEKNKISHRGQALRQAEEFLKAR